MQMSTLPVGYCSHLWLWTMMVVFLILVRTLSATGTQESGAESEESCVTKPFTYLIGSGWHASLSGFHPLQKINSRVDASVRTPKWFPVWYKHLLHFTDPVQVVVTDSNSPVLPPFVSDSKEKTEEHYPGLQWIRLSENFGHEAVSTSPTIGGWERSVLQGAFQALLNDVDYYIYVEQDLLVRGHDWVDYCVASMRDGKDRISFGAATNPTTTVGFGAQPLQQSLVIVSKQYLPTFINKIIQSKVTVEALDSAVERIAAEQRWQQHFAADVDLLPFGSGRTRPIPDGLYAYAQQMSRDEISTFLERSGLGSLLYEKGSDSVPEVQITLNLGAGQAAYRVPAGLHEQAFAQMLCLQVMRQQLKRTNIRWTDVQHSKEMVTCVQGVEGLARVERDKVLRQRLSKQLQGYNENAPWVTQYRRKIGYEDSISLACDPLSGSCACAAAWFSGGNGIIRRPYDDEVVLTRCFRPVDEASITHVFVEPGSWVATQLPMGRYECSNSTCHVSAEPLSSVKNFYPVDAYIGVSRHNQPPRVPAAFLEMEDSSSTSSRRKPLRVILNLENAANADKAKMCLNADIFVGYRDFCGSSREHLTHLKMDEKEHPMFIQASYISDPVIAFRLPPVDISMKKIMAFTMVRNCRATARNSKMQLVLNALRKQNIVVEHFGQCHFNEPAPHVCPVSTAGEEIQRGVCGPQNGKFVDPNHNAEKDCLLRYSKFYLAFENSQDPFYITEKLWSALKMGSIPIVWGDEVNRLRSLLPSPSAAIFVDDFESTEELATFVAKVNANDTLYATFLDWKKSSNKFQKQFEDAVAHGLERMMCSVCDAVSKS